MEDNRGASTSPDWKKVITYLGLTFGITYLLNLGLYLIVGSFLDIEAEEVVPVQVVLQLQMLIPATVGIILQLSVFRTSPIYHERSPLRWFLYAYLAYVAIFAALALGVLIIDNEVYLIAVNLITLALNFAILALVILLRLTAGREPFARAGLHGGPIRYWLTFGFGLILIYLVMTGLNALFDLGEAVDFMELLGVAGDTPGMEQIPPAALFALVAFQSVVLGPILGLTLGLGEEYGWRGLLQRELVKMGTVKGILLVGIIWGLWHAPIIAMGYNFPGYPILGPAVMTLYTIALGFYLGYAMLKSGSVWLAAFLHAVNNQVASFLLAAVYAPSDAVFSFGVGVYGLVIWAAIIGAFLLFDRDTWRGRGPAPAPLPTAETGL